MNRPLTAAEIGLIRGFLRQHPDVPGLLAQAAYAAYLGQGTQQAPAEAALRSHQRSAELCRLLTNPLAHDALTLLGYEFPAWWPYVQLLSAAATVVCQEHDRRKAVLAVGGFAIGLGVLALIFGDWG